MAIPFHPSRRGLWACSGVWLAVGIVFELGCSVAWAHDVNLTEVEVTFRADGTYEVRMRYDVDAYLIGVRPEHITESDLKALREMPPAQRIEREKDLRDLLGRRVRVRFDGQRVEPEIAFVPSGLPIARPTSQATTQAGQSSDDGSHASRVETIIAMTGTVPAGATTFDFWASRSFGTIILQAGRESSGRSHEIIEPGAGSKPIDLRAAPAPASRSAIAWQYLVLGFEHILPLGLDHILFVVGLFLLSTRWRPLLWQVSAFTVAHTLTLALSMLDVVRLSSAIVEPLIALSIAYVAIENICTTRLHVWRPAIVFGFGLLHGLGFAGVLSELGLPDGRFGTALVSFNAGVELGQLAVIALAFLVVGWCRGADWYRSRVVVPASCLIAATGLFWTVQRVM